MTHPTQAHMDRAKAWLGAGVHDPERDLAQLIADVERETLERAAIGGDAWVKEHDGEWCCCLCGPSKTSRGDWCDKGCGSDYNAMVRIDHWRQGRLLKLAIRALAAKE